MITCEWRIYFNIKNVHSDEVVNIFISIEFDLSIWKLEFASGFSKYNLSFVLICDSAVYANSCLLIPLESNAISSRDKPCEQWIIQATVNYIGYYIRIIRCVLFFPIRITFVWGSIDV